MNTNRLYKISDTEMLSFVGVLLEQARKDLAILAEFDSEITEKIDRLETQLEQAKRYPSDKQIVEHLGNMTAELHRIEEKCVSAYRKVRFFVQKAFKGNLVVQNQFRINDYEPSCHALPKHIEFMNEFSQATQQYRESLLASGANEQLLDSMTVAAVEFQQAYQRLEAQKTQRHATTHERIDSLNSLYQQAKQVIEKAIVAFGSDLPDGYRLQNQLPRKLEEVNF